MADAGRWRPPWLGCFCCALESKTYKHTDSYIKKDGQIKMSIDNFYALQHEMNKILRIILTHFMSIFSTLHIPLVLKQC